ncbi:MAG: polyprenyl synthetase family protein [bacterium]|nr:polyprenyl synthetase family protein [bacterium]
MNTCFKRNKLLIKSFLKNFLNQKKRPFSKVNQWGYDLLKRVFYFSVQGKMIRGGLILLSYEMFKKKIDTAAVRMAAAMELVHSALLIHDDIMDHDDVRRGDKTIYAQYQDIGAGVRTKDPLHFGESMGICVGDVIFFLSNELISSIPVQAGIKELIMRYWSEELAKVGTAQMQDIYFAITKEILRERDILNMYRYKTARYTFSLPLVLGAMAAGQKKQILSRLEQLGENLGILFQIKDDEIGLFGREEDTGKPVGSDIKENKKTLYHYYLFKNLSGTKDHPLKDLFGREKITSSMVHEIRSFIILSGVKNIIDKKMQLLEKRSKKMIQTLPVPVGYKNILHELVEFNMNRRS